MSNAGAECSADRSEHDLDRLPNVSRLLNEFRPEGVTYFAGIVNGQELKIILKGLARNNNLSGWAGG
jgi:hypothetical protein